MCQLYYTTHFGNCQCVKEEQIEVFHRIPDCVSETAAAEMRAAYKVGFKDGATMMQEIQE